jgi:hypothetical protein
MTGRAATTFDSTVEELWKLIGQVTEGELQLPEFQRSWVWDDDRIRSLLASVSVGYPIGTVMLLQTGNPEVRFKARPIESAPAADSEPERLLLDGQQRMTSLYQALRGEEPVRTQDERKKPIQRWYYMDIKRALDPHVDRTDAIVSVPETRQVRTLHEVILDVSSEEREWEQCMFPLRLVFGPNSEIRRWEKGLEKHGPPEGADARENLINRFEAEVLKTFEGYLMPTIVLGKASPKDAVCQVFEKVNTGGVSLTVFELLTATFAADDFDLRRDWQQTSEALATRNPLLRAVSDTDFLQTVTLLTTYDARRRWDERAASNGQAEGSDGRPPVSCKRRDVLRLTLKDYQQWREAAMRGYEAAGRLLMSQFFFAPKDLPYRTQLVPLAAILAVLGQDADAEAVKAQLRRWYWCGVFGEFYGSATETRFARDLPEVVAWVRGGAEPDTVAQASFAPGRLHTLRSRQSAAYKGLYALLMRDGARDFRTGDTIHLATYFDDQVDIHHVFPQGWFKDQDIENPVMDSVVNKTPLSKLTNIQIGKKAPSVYLSAIEAKHHLSRGELDAILRTHVIDPEIMRTDDFDAFYAARFEELLQRIETAMGKPIPREPEEASASAGQETVDYEGAAAADGQLSTVGSEDELAAVG